MKNIVFKILFVSLLSSIGYSCCLYTVKPPSYDYELVYENKTQHTIYFSDGKKIIDSIQATKNKIYYNVPPYIFDSDSVYNTITNKSVLYRMLSAGKTLFVKINNRCIQNESGKIEYSPFIGDEEIGECNKYHLGIKLRWTNGTGVYSYKKYTYIPDTKATGGRGYIMYTFTPSDTVGSVKCNF